MLALEFELTNRSQGVHLFEYVAHLNSTFRRGDLKIQEVWVGLCSNAYSHSWVPGAFLCFSMFGTAMRDKKVNAQAPDRDSRSSLSIYSLFTVAVLAPVGQVKPFVRVLARRLNEVQISAPPGRSPRWNTKTEPAHYHCHPSAELPASLRTRCCPPRRRGNRQFPRLAQTSSRETK